MYKDKDKQREAVRNAARRYRARKKQEYSSTTKSGEINDVFDNVYVWRDEKWRNVRIWVCTSPEKSSLGGGNHPENGGEVEHVG